MCTRRMPFQGPHRLSHPPAPQVLTRVFGNAMSSYGLPYDPLSYSMWTALTNEFDTKGKSSEWCAGPEGPRNRLCRGVVP